MVDAVDAGNRFQPHHPDSLELYWAKESRFLQNNLPTCLGGAQLFRRRSASSALQREGKWWGHNRCVGIPHPPVLAVAALMVTVGRPILTQIFSPQYPHSFEQPLIPCRVVKWSFTRVEAGVCAASIQNPTNISPNCVSIIVCLLHFLPRPQCHSTSCWIRIHLTCPAGSDQIQSDVRRLPGLVPLPGYCGQLSSRRLWKTEAKWIE